MTYPDYRRAANLAYRVLVRRGVNHLPVDPLAILRACRDTRVLTASQAADVLPACDVESVFAHADAVTWRCDTLSGPRYLTLYRPEGNPARLRFTLAHELGHRLLGHDGSDPAQEAEADCFASHLLCPDPALKRMLACCGRLPPEKIAAAFYVSRACAATLPLREPADVDAALLAAVDALLAPAVEALCRTSAMEALPKQPNDCI